MYYISHLFASRKPFIFVLMLPLLAYGGAVLLLSPHITHAAGNTYYVATTGSDSNSCAQAMNINAPKRNITGASGGLTCLASGDTLYIRAGTYTESLTNAAVASGSSSHTANTVVAGYPAAGHA